MVDARSPETGTVNQWVLVTTDRWPYEELYLRGNLRVARFFAGSRTYVPISQRWTSVREACALELVPEIAPVTRTCVER